MSVALEVSVPVTVDKDLSDKLMASIRDAYENTLLEGAHKADEFQDQLNQIVRRCHTKSFNIGDKSGELSIDWNGSLFTAKVTVSF